MPKSQHAQESTDKELPNTELADQAYSHNDLLRYDAERLWQLTRHFNTAGAGLFKTGVTRQLLWQECLSAHPDGYSYSCYCQKGEPNNEYIWLIFLLYLSRIGLITGS